MRLWYLWRSGDGYRDRIVAVLIRAASEKRAREIAVEQVPPPYDRAWRDSDLTLCLRITEDGDEEILMQEMEERFE